MTHYIYKNDIGRMKRLSIDRQFQNKDGKYHTTLWDCATGEWCGAAYLSEKELQEHLDHYKNVRVEND